MSIFPIALVFDVGLSYYHMRFPSYSQIRLSWEYQGVYLNITEVNVPITTKSYMKCNF